MNHIYVLENDTLKKHKVEEKYCVFAEESGNICNNIEKRFPGKYNIFNNILVKLRMNLAMYEYEWVVRKINLAYPK